MDKFIVMIQPDLNNLREKSRYSNPKDISDLFGYYKKHKLSTGQLKKLLFDIPHTTKPSDRVAACIIAVGTSENEDLAEKQISAARFESSK